MNRKTITNAIRVSLAGFAATRIAENALKNEDVVGSGIRKSTGGLVRRVVSFAIALCFSISAIGECRAAGLELYPTHILLTAHDHASTITLTNTDTVPLRVEVNMFRWTQGIDGHDVLSSTEALIVFPQLLTIPAKEQRTLRVATTDAVASQEGTYKVSITEIGSFSSPATPGANLAVRMQANVPVFIAPTVDRQGAAIAAASIQKEMVRFDVLNTGTSHFITKDVRIVGIGVDTRPVFSQGLSDSEVLAGSKRSYRIGLSRQQCSALRALTIQVVAGEQHLVQTLDVPSGACNA